MQGQTTSNKAEQRHARSCKCYNKTQNRRCHASSNNVSQYGTSKFVVWPCMKAGGRCLRWLTLFCVVVWRCSILTDAVWHCFAKKLQMLLIDIEPACQTASNNVSQYRTTSCKVMQEVKMPHLIWKRSIFTSLFDVVWPCVSINEA